MKRRDLKGLTLLGLRKKTPRRRWLEDLVGRLCAWLWKRMTRERERGE